MKQQLLLFIFQFNPVLLLLVILTFSLKLILFCKFKTEDWKLYHLFYFKTSEIAGARTGAGVEVKIAHNSLTAFLVFLGFVKILFISFVCGWHFGTFS